MEKQLSFEFQILSSGKQQHSSLKKHLSSKKDKKPKQKNQERQLVTQLLPKVKEELKLKSLSLEGVKAEDNPLKETPPDVHSPKEELLFENLVSVEIVAEVLGLAPKTIRNWVSARRIPFVRVGRKVMFRRKSFELWLNRKEIKSWL
jgi:excisionase family DNA binding protein